MNTFYQAISMGIISVIIGLILYNIFMTSNTNEVLKQDKTYIMEASIFFTGVMLRYILEIPIAQQYLYND